MKRRVAGIGIRAEALDPALAGLFLVRIASARLRRQRCTLQLEVLEPEEHAGLHIQTTLELAEDRLWKPGYLRIFTTTRSCFRSIKSTQREWPG